MGARRIVVVAASVLLAVTAFAPVSVAADTVTVPTTAGQSVTVTWSGIVLPGVNSSSDCTSSLLADTHEIDLVVPAGTYDQVAVLAKATIDYTGPADLIVTAVLSSGDSVSADNGFVNTPETVSFANPPAGLTQVKACAFASAAPQPYTGTLELTAAPAPPPTPASCSAPGKPLSFTAPSYVDTTRAGGEPSVFALADGSLLYAAHAGTTHFYSLEADDDTTSAFYSNYRGQVHAWYSADKGASWTFVDRTLPPDNAPGSGFSDPDFAIDAAGNIYLSEINLANVAVSRSTTGGRSYTLQNFFAQTITDRQWTAAGPANVLFIVGNPSGGGTFPTDPLGHNGHTIYRSTDGGKTYSAGVADPGGLGDIVFDQKTKTLYEARLADGNLQIAAFRRALDPVATTALTPEVTTIAEGVSLLSHWPALDVDAKGNVYVAWDERGTSGRAGGIWYSYSTTGGRSWATPARVDADSNTDIWPWIAVGDPGRVAVAWFGTDRHLPNNEAEAATDSDPWNVYVAQTQNGLGCLGSSIPGFRVTRATPDPFHSGTICTGGTACQAELIDRRLGDYFTIDIDATGALVAAYSDTRQGGAVSLPAFFRQTGGTSFQKGPPAGKGK